MLRSTITTLAGLVVCAGLAAAQTPLSTNNAASVCVQYGDCTSLGQNTFATATQFAPVTPPAFTPGLVTVVNPASDTAYLSSLAAAGGSAAFNANGGGGGGGAGSGQTAVAGNQGQQGQDAATPAPSINLGQGAGSSGSNSASGASSSYGSAAGGFAVLALGAVVGGLFIL